MTGLKQLCFTFIDVLAGGRRVAPPEVVPAPAPAPASPKASPGSGRDAALEGAARAWLGPLAMSDGMEKLRVVWNPRLRSTAGYAKWPQWLVELNPRLKEFEGQTERTLKHELAHLVAYARAGRRRISPHGTEWRRACADLGIPDERASHTMPLPRHKQRRKFSYLCPACGAVAERVRRFKRRTACLVCCRKHNGGRYDERFRFVLREG